MPTPGRYFTAPQRSAGPYDRFIVFLETGGQLTLIDRDTFAVVATGNVGDIPFPEIYDGSFTKGFDACVDIIQTATTVILIYSGYAIGTVNRAYIAVVTLQVRGASLTRIAESAIGSLSFDIQYDSGLATSGANALLCCRHVSVVRSVLAPYRIDSYGTSAVLDIIDFNAICLKIDGCSQDGRFFYISGRFGPSDDSIHRAFVHSIDAYTLAITNLFTRDFNAADVSYGKVYPLGAQDGFFLCCFEMLNFSTNPAPGPQENWSLSIIEYKSTGDAVP
ncbi:hypothetical protein [Sinorhizobium meliloti]|uniref:hypothetical protein n=1 Tax=Rhizobium meliloti TaxID=382 RepID=UPI0018E730E3|nr:hypothetical protein [Sinorhizobium meliloti]QQF06262.1 hypothetical protein JFX10_24985 [Sinorhizobium meliloti]